MQSNSTKLSNLISSARNSKLAAIAAAFLLQTGCKQHNLQSANQKGFEQSLQQISKIMKVRESYFAGSDRTVVILSSIHRPEVEKKVAEKMSCLDKVFKLDVIGLEGNIHGTQNPADLQVAAEYDKIFAAAEAIPNTLKTGDLIQVYTPVDNSGFRLNNHIENSGFNSIITGLETVDQKKAIKHKVIGVVIHKMDFIEQEIATKGHCVMAVGDKPTRHALELTSALDWLNINYPGIPLPKSISTAPATLKNTTTKMSVIEETLFQGLADWYKQFREAVNPEILQERNKTGAERLDHLMTENDFKNGAIIIGARHTLKFSAEDFKSIHEFLLDKNISVIIVDPEELNIKIK